MDILVYASEPSDRAASFEKFVHEEGHQVQRVAPGKRLPASEHLWLGAVFFDQGAADLPALLREPREQLRYLGISLVVVTPQEKVDSQKQLCAAGADVVCAPDTPDALILKELIGRSHAQPVAPELRAQLVEPLITAVTQTLSEMAGAEAFARSVYQRETPAVLGDVSASLEISSPLEGALILSFSKGTAEALEKRVFAEVVSEPDRALLPDCMGEIANVLAGQAKALLAGTPYHFIFSTPHVSTSEHGIKLRENMDSLVIAFDSDLGGLALQLCRSRS